MNPNHESLSIDYTAPEAAYLELATEELKNETFGKIFYYCPQEGVFEAEGKLVTVDETESEGTFLILDSGKRIRIDRVISLFGKPSAAYDAFDAFSDACLDCIGGFDKDE